MPGDWIFQDFGGHWPILLYARGIQRCRSWPARFPPVGDRAGGTVNCPHGQTNLPDD
jgi:hypothetical protein